MQLSFDFPFQEKYQPEEFITSSCNELAFNFVKNYDLKNSSLPKIFALKAPKFAGKTYLSNIWAKKNNAEILNLEELDNINLVKFIGSKKCYVIEDVEKIKNLELFLQIFNLAFEKMSYLMLTSSNDFLKIGTNIPDLNSRLKNIFAVEIFKPDDDLIKMLLIKNFSEKQLKAEDRVIDFIANNLNRDFGTIHDFVKLIEFYSREKRCKITIPLIKDIITY